MYGSAISAVARRFLRFGADLKNHGTQAVTIFRRSHGGEILVRHVVSKYGFFLIRHAISKHGDFLISETSSRSTVSS